MANLVIMESPSKANTVKSYLGSNYKVIASIGHIRDLPKSTLGVDIENDFEAHYINIRGKGDIIKEIKKEAKNANKIFLATDPDREGEAISWHLATALGIPLEKTQRVTFNEITKNVVKAAIKKPRNIDMSLVDAQQARRILDRIVGYKISPLLWKNVKSGLSAGRVQSVATRIIVEREEEIKSFVPVEYWTIEVTLLSSDGKPFTVRFFGDANGKIELSNEAEAMAVVNALNAKSFEVKAVKRSTRHKAPQPPFTTSTLQQEGYKKLGFQSQRTMRTAQELYEGINLGSENGGVQGLITYMRTDSLRVSAEAQDAARAYIADKFGDKYNTEEPRVFKSKSGVQDAHEAIRPSNVNLDPKKIKAYLSADQYKLYKLIWDRFLASQMESAELATLNVEVESAGYIFRTGGYTVAFPGYMAVYEESADETAAEGEEQKNAKIPELVEGEKLDSDHIDPTKHFTEPPPRFNEGSLVKFLEEKGIGRPSTFESTITTITSRNYVKREGKNKVLVPTPLGEITTKLMCENFDSIVDYEFTAEMENKLDAIEKSEQTLNGVLEEFWANFSKQLEVAQEKLAEANIELPVEETDIECEKCGSMMVVKNGRFGKFAACPNYPRCRNTKPLTATKPEDEVDVEETQAEEKKENAKKLIVADFKCEKCGSNMVLRTGRYGSFYACVNYPACKNTKQKTKDIGVPCPECGAKIVTRYSRSKTAFYGCERYPECKFSSWDMPMEKKCPDCGKNLFHKKGKPQLICHDEKCGYSEPYVSPEKTDDGEEN